jgi:hypothetical protein
MTAITLHRDTHHVDLCVENQQVFREYLAEEVARRTLMNILGTRCQMLDTAKNGDYNCEGVSVSELLISEREVKEQARTLAPG